MDIRDWGKYEFDGSSVIRITNVANFVDWFRQRAYEGALQSVGHTFFKDKETFNFISGDVIEYGWELGSTFFELDLIVRKRSKSFVVEADELSKSCQTLSNQFLYQILSSLSDRGIMQLCWNKKKKDFVWHFLG